VTGRRMCSCAPGEALSCPPPPAPPRRALAARCAQSGRTSTRRLGARVPARCREGCTALHCRSPPGFPPACRMQARWHARKHASLCCRGGHIYASCARVTLTRVSARPARVGALGRAQAHILAARPGEVRQDRLHVGQRQLQQVAEPLGALLRGRAHGWASGPAAHACRQSGSPRLPPAQRDGVRWCRRAGGHFRGGTRQALECVRFCLGGLFGGAAVPCEQGAARGACGQASATACLHDTLHVGATHDTGWLPHLGALWGGGLQGFHHLQGKRLSEDGGAAPHCSGGCLRTASPRFGHAPACLSRHVKDTGVSEKKHARPRTAWAGGRRRYTLLRIMHATMGEGAAWGSPRRPSDAIKLKGSHPSTAGRAAR
jgi:hypothetical protein